MLRRFGTAILLSIALAAFAPACEDARSKGAEAPGQAIARNEAPGTPHPSATESIGPGQDVRTPSSGSVHIDDRIVQACGTLPTPHFAFDSAAIRGPAADALGSVARCFVDGPLRGRRIKLVGRADPRGTATYNLALGQDRAASVARYLESSGMSPARVGTMSRGAFDAAGTDAEGWARDRRVDLVLGD